METLILIKTVFFVLLLMLTYITVIQSIFSLRQEVDIKIFKRSLAQSSLMCVVWGVFYYLTTTNVI